MPSDPKRPLSGYRTLLVLPSLRVQPVPVAVFVSWFIVAMVPGLVHNALATGNALVSTQAGHAESIAFGHLFVNKGLLGGDLGGLSRYLTTLNEHIPVGIAFAPLGLFLLVIWGRRHLALVLLAWAVPTFLLYAAWLNPYPRYIMPTFPAVALATAYAVVEGPVLVARLLGRRYAVLAVVAIVVTLGAVFPHALDSAKQVARWASGAEELPVQVFSRSDAVAPEGLRSLFGDHPSVIVYDGARPYTRGVVEAYTGARTVTTRFYDISTGRLGRPLATDDVLRVVAALRQQGIRVFWWRNEFPTSLNTGCTICASTPLVRMHLSFERDIAIYLTVPYVDASL